MTDGIVERLRRQARRVVELYGDPEPPEYDMNPADLLWFTVQDAADEIERLRAQRDEVLRRLRAEADDCPPNTFGIVRLAATERAIAIVEEVMGGE